MEFYIKAAVELARTRGVEKLSRDGLSEHLGIPAGSFAHKMGVSYTAFMSQVVDRIPLHELRGASCRMPPGLRRRQVLAHAVELSKARAYWTLSAQAVADAAGISRANLARLYTLPELRKAVIQWAIETDDAELIAQARTAKDPLVK